MIRVNLLKTYTGTVAVSPTGTVAPVTAVGTSATSMARDGMQPEILVKLVILVVPFVAMMSYDYYRAGQRQRTETQVNAELTDAKAKMEALKPQVEAVTKFQENKKALQAKIDVIRAISKERLKNVKALDALQALMPPKAWLEKLTIKDNRVTLEGFAIEDLDVSQLMQGLEESVFFANVILKSVESDKKKEGVVKRFSIESNLENM